MSRDPRLVVYCIIPPAGAAALDDVRAHYAGTGLPVQVLVERRVAQRRRPLDEEPASGSGAGAERRRGPDRRRLVVPRHLSPLPEHLAERTGPVRWVQRLLPVGPSTEELSTDDIVAAVRAGDAEAPTELYWRCYERMRSALAVMLGDAREVDAAVVRALGRVLDALEDPEHAGTAFEPLLYEQIDACAAEVHARRAGLHAVPEGGLAVLDPELHEPVEVGEAMPHWSRQAAADREQLLDALGDHVIDIEHVGSTAVPAVAARPTIDLIAGLHGMPATPAALAVLRGAGFSDHGDAGVPGRHYLRRRGDGDHVDLHLVEYGGALWNDALVLRDFLRRHAPEAQRWAEVKYKAAAIAPASTLRYYDLRRLMLDDLLEQARLRAARTAGAPLQAAA